MESDTVSTGSNPWRALFERCQQTNWSLDEIRDCIGESPLNTDLLLKELQFLSDDEEMVAFRIVREYSREAAQQWDDGSKSSEWKQAKHRHKDIMQIHQQLCSDLEQRQQELDTIEQHQENILQKFSLQS